MKTPIVFALLLLLAVPAAAQELTSTQEEARQHYEAGEGLADRGDWASALREFEQAYEGAAGLPNRYLIGLDLALANAELERYREAIRLLEEFLAVAPPDDERRAEAEQRLREARLRVELEGGQIEASPIGITILAVGVASTIAGVILGSIALQQDGDARATCVDTRCSQSAFDSIGQAHDFAIAADILLWGGLGVAAIGSILAVALGTSSSSTNASAMCTGDGCALAIEGSF